MNIPYELNNIQPRATQVWNCDGIGFDPNERWSKGICTYKFFQGEQMLRVQTGYQDPFLCMLLLFTWVYGQCFMPPIIVHQSNEYSEDPHFNISLDSAFHHTPSGYMDRYEWLKSMTKLSNVCVASPVDNKIIFFNGHDSHFEDHLYMDNQNIQPFILKSVESINNHPNDNGPNSKLKSLYNEVNFVLMLKYGTIIFYLTTWYQYWRNHGTPLRCQP